MEVMSLTLTWHDVVVRLFCAIVTGTLIGLDRGEAGKVAGLRTTLLVCLAACLAMLQVNSLLAQAGRPAGSLVELDLMRLPLGILSGVGFIGAGAIMRKDGLVRGVTTAATLWYVTVLGLCIGGGQLTLGVSGLVLGMVILWGVKRVERRVSREQSARLTVEYDRTTSFRETFLAKLHAAGCHVHSTAQHTQAGIALCEESFEIRWRGKPDDPLLPPLTDTAVEAGARSCRWALGR
ncbi:MAG: MgtC/SapB family protein [Janthinobacterium lividum]